MPRKITRSDSFHKEKEKELLTFYKLPENERINLVCELSEVLLNIQYENGILPEDENLTLTR